MAIIWWSFTFTGSQRFGDTTASEVFCGLFAPTSAFVQHLFGCKRILLGVNYPPTPQYNEYMQDARAVANYFLDLAEREGETLSAMKLQKLIYFAHGWTLALNREPLINEPIEAWEYGPVIPSVYREFKKFGSGPITDRSVVATSDPDDPYSLIAVPRGIPEREASTRKFLDAIWNAYKGYSAVQLSNLTHLPGTPWEKVYRGSSRNKPIPNEEIQRYFESQSQPQ